MTVTLIDHNRDNEKEFDTRAEAEEKANDMVALGAHPDDIEIVGGEVQDVDAEIIDHTEDSEDGSEPTEVTDGGTQADVHPTPQEPPHEDSLPDDPPIDDDPVDWLPSHFIDDIQGVPTVNRKGYAVIASKYGISVTAEPVTLPSESDFEYAEFRAVATTPEGQEYSGFGSAHVDRDDGDDPHLLAELAETRAMKRATAWASGVGLTAIEEMKNNL